MYVTISGGYSSRHRRCSRVVSFSSCPLQLPDERSIPPGGYPNVTLDWGASGAPSAWTEIDVTTRGVTPGTGDVTSEVGTLLDSLAEPTVLYFPGGEYIIDSLSVRRSNVVIRGELSNGQPITTFRSAGSGRILSFSGSGGRYDYQFLGPEFQPRAVVNDVVPGSSTLDLDDTAGLSDT